jgi:hypothetical protein
MVVVLCLVALLVFALLIAPRVDEGVGFFTARALKTIQSYKAEGVPLRQVVNSRFQSARWRAYHQDIPFQTFVECVGVERAHGARRRMLWYVDERLTWDHGPTLRVVVMTVLNGDALELTPSLFDPRAGFGLDRWRHGVELP